MPLGCTAETQRHEGLINLGYIPGRGLEASMSRLLAEGMVGERMVTDAFAPIAGETVCAAPALQRASRSADPG